MKTAILTLFAVFLIVGFLIASDEYPEGFLDLKWGASVQEFLELKNPSPTRLDKPDAKGQRIGYRPITSLGGVDVSGAAYYFYNGEFYSVFVPFKSYEAFRILYDALVMKYGRPKIGGTGKDGGMALGWKFEDTVEISLVKLSRPSTIPGAEGVVGSLTYEFRPIRLRNEKKSSEKTKDAL